MSRPQPPRPPSQRVTLTAAPPVRALAIAAGAEVVAALLLVLWRSADLPLAVAVLGALLLGLGGLLLAAALVLTGRLRTEVVLEPEVLTVVRGRVRRSVPWGDVTGVTWQHPRLTVTTADPDGGLVVVNPRPQGDPRFDLLVRTIQERLDADRGYRDLS